jgi:hypothetical protein
MPLLVITPTTAVENFNGRCLPAAGVFNAQYHVKSNSNEFSD